MIGPYKLNQIYTGDARELSKAIPDNSIDLIFTDPPYLKEYLPLYDWLASEADRILKPGGFCLCYVGGAWKAEIFRYFAAGDLTFWWDYFELNAGAGSIVWNRKTVARGKSILAYVKGKGAPRCNVLGVWNGGGKDKDHHEWGQEESTARYYIDCFTDADGMILDPFCGGGTVPAMCNYLQRNWLAFEVDFVTAQDACKRVATSILQRPVLPEFDQYELYVDAEAQP